MRPAYPARPWRRSVSAVVRAGALVLMTATLGGCYTTREQVASAPPPPPNDYRLRHPISIQEKDRTVVLFIGNSRGGLTPSQRADVLAFAHRWQREATGGVVIEVPTGTPNERAAADTVHEVQSILVATGLPVGGIAVRNYQPADPGKLAVVRLIYPKMTADAGPCGQWPEDLGPDIHGFYVENRPYYNLGCATQRNLAAMVENPADLVQPRGETAPYGARRATVFDKYRKGEPTGAQNQDAANAKISDVGK